MTDGLALAHSVRFRKVSTLFPHLVARAYRGDLARAMRATDAEVRKRVAAWERENRLTPRNWRLIGRRERA
jgi:hypothetical protein